MMSRPISSRNRGATATNDFDENSPRPPVPGEETAFPQPHISYKGTPRVTSQHAGGDKAPLGFEPEGSCGDRGEYREGSRSPPPCLLWARDLHTLLADTEGVELFRMYLEQEGRPHADALNFWFACEGLKKQTDKERILQLVKVIYRKFITSSQLGIREELRREITQRIREGAIDQTVFDAAQSDVGQRITTTTYPNFLKSDIYLNYVQQLPPESLSSVSGSGSGSGSSSSSGGKEPAFCSGGSLMLPTLHEDAELVVAADERSKQLPLTRDMLAATQGRRAFDLRPRPEAFAGVYLQQSSSGLQQSALRAYSSYNPVSRQDSELQSLSSDARTDSDAMSCTDSSIDGASLNQSKLNKRYYQRQARAIKENAHINRDLTPYLIPRTQRANSMPSSLQPAEFARILTLKLETVLRAQETQEALEARLLTAAATSAPSVPIPLATITGTALTDHPARSLADVIREKFQVDDGGQDCDQAILDKHVSRVWADRTPCGSPPVVDCSRRKAPIHPYQARPAPSRHPRVKEKDLQSTFSTDSGNVPDYPDSSTASTSRQHLSKSKSIPEYNAMHESRYPATDYTDSGVSVISEHPPPCRDPDWVVTWLRESDRHRANTAGSGGRKREETMGQLEEARRRLEEVEGRRGRGRLPSNSSQPASMNPINCSIKTDAQSAQSTLRRPQRKISQSEEAFTTVMFSFCDEQFPYRTKMKGSQPTLKQFKEILPKKGNYRYYFKTECDEEECRVIQQEVIDDNEILPLWEGKLIAQVKAVE